MAYSLKKEPSRCLSCGSPITYGRQDKKFCCEHCKNDWHNRRGRRARIFHLKVERALEKNYRVLGELLRRGVDSIGWVELRALGFNPDVVTSYHKVGIRQEYRCFDLSYLASSTRIFRLRSVLTDENTPDEAPGV